MELSWCLYSTQQAYLYVYTSCRLTLPEQQMQTSYKYCVFWVIVAVRNSYIYVQVCIHRSHFPDLNEYFIGITSEYIYIQKLGAPRNSLHHLSQLPEGRMALPGCQRVQMIPLIQVCSIVHTVIKTLIAYEYNPISHDITQTHNIITIAMQL